MLFMCLIIFVLIFLMIYQLVFTQWKSSLPKKLNQVNFFYYGHRGVPTMAPENTLLSFQEAINNNLDGIELDVQLTKDQQLVVYHDKYINYGDLMMKINGWPK